MWVGSGRVCERRDERGDEGRKSEQAYPAKSEEGEVELREAPNGDQPRRGRRRVVGSPVGITSLF